MEEALSGLVGVPGVGEGDETGPPSGWSCEEEGGGCVVAECLGDCGEEEDELM